MENYNSLQESGYNFTPEEFETYTYELLESSQEDGELKDLDEQELEAVFGGASRYLPQQPIMQLYGVIWPPKDWGPQLLYGVIQDPELFK